MYDYSSAAWKAELLGRTGLRKANTTKIRVDPTGKLIMAPDEIALIGAISSTGSGKMPCTTTTRQPWPHPHPHSEVPHHR